MSGDLDVTTATAAVLRDEDGPYSDLERLGACGWRSRRSLRRDGADMHRGVPSLPPSTVAFLRS
jgi:hypothetical protein